MNNKRGFIITLDVLLGIVLLMITFFVVTVFITTPNSAQHEYVKIRVSSNIVHSLILDGSISALDDAVIEERLYDLLPAEYGMMIRLQGDFAEGNGTLDLGDDLPQNTNLAAGSMTALSEDAIYLRITYFIWGK